MCRSPVQSILTIPEYVAYVTRCDDGEQKYEKRRKGFGLAYEGIEPYIVTRQG